MLNIRKDPGVSRFEFEIGFSVEASVEFYIISSHCIEKRSQLLKEIMDKHEIYSNKEPPPQKRSRKMLIIHVSPFSKKSKKIQA